ncbi:MAG: hypothetical protein WAN43_03130 [Rhodomicrobium sp.]
MSGRPRGASLARALDARNLGGELRAQPRRFLHFHMSCASAGCVLQADYGLGTYLEVCLLLMAEPPSLIGAG